jgi:hypothetical protein
MIRRLTMLSSYKKLAMLFHEFYLVGSDNILYMQEAVVRTPVILLIYFKGEISNH